MDDDQIDSITHRSQKGAVILASLPPGTVCKLVGIVEGLFGGHKHRFAHKRGRHGFGGGMHGLTGRNREMLRRLMDLGLTRGCVFQVVHGGGNGPVLIEVRGSRIALGHRIARRLLVEEVTDKK